MNSVDSIRDLILTLEFLIDEALEEFEGFEPGAAYRAIEKAKQALLDNESARENITGLASVDRRNELGDDWLSIALIGAGREGEWIDTVGGYEFRINYY